MGYRGTREALGQPDPIRFRYRPQLAEVVRDSVVELRPPQRAGVRAWAEVHEVPAADLDAFTDTALAFLIDLHEGAHDALRTHIAQSRIERDRIARRTHEGALGLLRSGGGIRIATNRTVPGRWQCSQR